MLSLELQLGSNQTIGRNFKEKKGKWVIVRVLYDYQGRSVADKII
jgi:hypothetical protein